MNLLLLILAAAAAFAITAIVRKHALANAILDIPNQRSSHSIPTPRGGGIAIAIVSLSGIALGWFIGLLPGHIALGIGGGSGAVAVMGWLDDRASLSAGVRLAVQAAAAAWAVYWLGGMSTLRLAGSDVHFGAAGSVIAVMGIIWVTNLFNFMDGIDGLAAAEAISVGVAGAALLSMFGRPAMTTIPLVLVAANAGFLVWNWAPAKIFMGDVGSNFVGFAFASFALASENSGALPLAGWLVLALVFIADATITLARRALRRERVYAAHRQHAYQRAVAAGYSHATVTLTAIVLNGVLATLVGAHYFLPDLRGAPLVLGLLLLVTVYLAVERVQPMRTD